MARRRTPYGGAVRFEEEDVSVLGGDLRLASFEAGEAVAVWWWCGGQHGDARSVCLSLCLSLTCSLSLSLFLQIRRGSSGGPWWWRAAAASDVRRRAWRSWLQGA
jgi:hypothetical protein